MAISITDLGHRRRIREILRLCGNPVGGGTWSRWIALFLLLLNLNRCISGQSIIAPGGRTLFNGASLIRSFIERDHFLLETPDGKSVSITRYVTPLALVYGFYPKWTMILVQPYIVNHSTSREGEQIRHANSNGLADSQLFVHYDGLYSRNSPGGLTRLSAVFGLQVPTGAERFSTRAVEFSAPIPTVKHLNGLQPEPQSTFLGGFRYLF